MKHMISFDILKKVSNWDIFKYDKCHLCCNKLNIKINDGINERTCKYGCFTSCTMKGVNRIFKIPEYIQIFNIRINFPISYTCKYNSSIQFYGEYHTLYIRKKKVERFIKYYKKNNRYLMEILAK